MCRALPQPSVRLGPVDKILRGGGHPCTRICHRAMTRGSITLCVATQGRHYVGESKVVTPT
jgi:hypothetical protein